MKNLCSAALLTGLFTLAALGSAQAQLIRFPKIGGTTIKLPTPASQTQTGRSGSITQQEAALGLKEALTQGISKGADQASRQDGFYLNKLIRIPFPQDAQRVATTMRKIGLGAEVDRFELALNRGAEQAATKAKPIFISAIRSLTFTDVWNILTGGQKDAATQYLKRTTTSQLTTAFAPIMQQALDQTNATKYYTNLVTRYNMIPLVTPVNPNLNEYATGKAIDGLFTLIAQEEANIRENPVARTTDLLRRVFGSRK